MYDNILSDYPRLNGETDDSARIQRAIDDTSNGVLCIPKGDYDIKKTIYIKNRCSLDMHPAARLIAKDEMDFVVEYCAEGDYNALSVFNEDGSVYDNLGLFIRGGDIDGNGLASCCSITNAHHFTLANTAFHNGKKYGLCVGGDKDSHIYELICNNIYCKCTMKGLSGNIGIYTNKCDAHYTDCIIVDYTIGMQICGAANRITRCHIWGGTVPPECYSVKEWSEIYRDRKIKLKNGVYGENEQEEYENDVPEMLINSIAFDIRGWHNVLDGCYADTAEIGYNIIGSTRLTNCDFFNNKLMGLKRSTAINHLKGELTVVCCTFRGTVGSELLYEGIGEDTEWISCSAVGGEGMKLPI